MANPDALSLSCQELIELVTDYVEGTLSPADQARFESHLGVCADCYHYLDQVRQTIAWEPRISPTLSTTPAPTAEELRLVREELDPEGIYTK